MKNLCVKLIELYRKYISPLKPPCCRFYPTCSEYAVQAFNKHGFFGGLILSVCRILRCNPLCKPGYDPVPDTIFNLKFLNGRRTYRTEIKTVKRITMVTKGKPVTELNSSVVDNK